MGVKIIKSEDGKLMKMSKKLTSCLMGWLRENY